MIMPHLILREMAYIFSRIFSTRLCDKKLVRILTSLSFSHSLSHNLMVLKKHRLDWLAAACLIWIVLCIYMMITVLVYLFANLENM